MRTLIALLLSSSVAAAQTPTPTPIAHHWHKKSAFQMCMDGADDVCVQEGADSNAKPIYFATKAGVRQPGEYLNPRLAEQQMEAELDATPAPAK